jgi:GNAT superfamily N-acetyltransferase
VARPWSSSDERAYIEGLSPRDVVFVAVADGRVVGFETLDGWARYPSFMDHVGQLGTFVSPEWHGRQVGQRLAQATLEFARAHHCEKLIKSG